MAIIYTYPLTELLATDDTIVITDSSSPNKATRSATISQINALGPQGTVTDVTITMPVGFTVDKTPDPFSSGEINFDIALTSGLQLPADDPDNSVQFNKNGLLTGEPGFTFEIDSVDKQILNLGNSINDGNRRGEINLYNRGRIALWATTAGGSNQAVALTGPRTVATSNPGSYEISLPAEDPSLNDPVGPLYAEPRVWVINGDDLSFREYESKFMRPSELGISAAGEAFELQFRKSGNPGIFDASEQLQIVPLAGQSAIIQGLTLSVGSMLRNQVEPPQRGDVRIGSGPINQNGPNDYGASLNLEYVSPGAGPVSATPGQNPAAAYSHVALRAPKYDNTIGTGPNEGAQGENMSITYQDYSLILPQLNPEKSDDLQPYASSKLLVVNSVDATTNSQRYFETKFVDTDNLGIGAAGQTNNIQYKAPNGGFDASSAFQYSDNNGGTGAPNSKPHAHEVILGAGGGGLPGMLTLFGDNDDVEAGGTDGILRFVSTTGKDYATISGPDIQTEISLTTGGSGYEVIDSSTTFSTSNQSGQGSDLAVFVKVDVSTGEIIAVSIANQGTGYNLGDVLDIVDPQGQGQGATVTVIAVRDANNPDDEAQIYDIKLPKYTPFNDKIWFGKGTGKNGELTTSDYFKIPLIQDANHSPGGRLQLTIGSDNLTQNEPWGSILINGGNNTNESGVIRLASVYNSVVGIMGPKATNPPAGVSYDYDFMLPYLPPKETQRNFINGVETVNLTSGGTGIVPNGTTPKVSTTVIDPQTGNPIPGSGKNCIVEVLVVNEEVDTVDIVEFGDGYSVGDVLKINTSGTPEIDKARITVTSVGSNKSKLLVVNEQATPSATTYETRWIDPNDLISQPQPVGFAPLPVYQGDEELTSTGGTSITWITQTVCDNGGGALTKAKYFSSATSGSLANNSVKIRCAVYEGEIITPNATSLVAYGEYDTFPNAGLQELEEGVNEIDITDGGNMTWTPTEGSPIIVVWEIANESGADMGLLGSSFNAEPGSLISSGAISLRLEDDQLFEIKPQPGSQISPDITGADEGTQRPCTHFIP